MVLKEQTETEERDVDARAKGFVSVIGRANVINGIVFNYFVLVMKRINDILLYIIFNIKKS